MSSTQKNQPGKMPSEVYQKDESEKNLKKLVGTVFRTEDSIFKETRDGSASTTEAGRDTKKLEGGKLEKPGSRPETEEKAPETYAAVGRKAKPGAGAGSKLAKEEDRDVMEGAYKKNPGCHIL